MWSDEQSAIIQFISDPPANLLVRALAGTGKTTVIVEGLKAWAPLHPGKKALFMVFNRRNAEELQARLGNAARAGTFNGVGHKAMIDFLRPKKLDLQQNKMYKILNPLFDYDERGDTPRLVGLLKANGWVPKAVANRWGIPGGLVEDTDEFIQDLIDEHTLDCPVGKATRAGLGYFDTLRVAFEKSVSQAFDGIIDFDDQLYVTALWRAPLEKYDLVIIDEEQDVNKIQFRMIRQCVAPKGRIIGVGDEHQGIYAFRGAGTESMDEFQREFQAETLPLTTCWRCAEDVITAAQAIVPSIRARPDAPKGKVTYWEPGKQFAAQNFLATDAILCRNVRPLVTLCYSLIRAQMPATILGRDIGKGLVTIVQKLAKTHPKMEDFYPALSSWAEAQKAALNAKEKESAAATLEDKVETILAMCDSLDQDATVEDLIRLIESMFSDTAGSRLTLSTVHKAKGLEWDRVFILDPWRMPSKWAKTPSAIAQEMNIKYVATTRARFELILIDERSIQL